MSSIHKKQKGFTLIEVIISIIIAGLAGVIIFTYLGNVLTRSHEPIAIVQDLAEMVGVMEEVIKRYDAHLSNSAPGVMFNCNDLVDVSAPPSGVGISVGFNSGISPSPDFSGGGIIEDAHYCVVTVTKDQQSITAVFTR